MENYENKYKEAFKKGNTAYKHLKAALERIFPELRENKESDSERIRKELIAFLRENHETGRADETWSLSGIERWIIWLEKQGEPVEINPTEFDTRLQTLIGKFDSLPKEELANSLSFYLNVVQNNGTYKSYEKQGEQKPAKQPYNYELEEEIEEWLGCEAFPEGTNITPLPKAMEIVRETANHFYDFGRKQQSIRNIQYTNSQVITPESYINEGQKKGIQIVLDNPQEYGLQKPAEWSEDDENKIEELVVLIRHSNYTDGIKHKVISWLKSLRHQKQWKPLGKHLEALALVINDEPLDISVRDDLNELYEQLKQL